MFAFMEILTKGAHIQTADWPFAVMLEKKMEDGQGKHVVKTSLRSYCTSPQHNILHTNPISNYAL